MWFYPNYSLNGKPLKSGKCLKITRGIALIMMTPQASANMLHHGQHLGQGDVICMTSHFAGVSFTLSRQADLQALCNIMIMMLLSKMLFCKSYNVQTQSYFGIDYGIILSQKLAHIQIWNPLQGGVISHLHVYSDWLLVSMRGGAKSKKCCQSNIFEE